MVMPQMIVLYGWHTVRSCLCSYSLHFQGNNPHQQSYPDVKLMSNIITEHDDKLAQMPASQTSVSNYVWLQDSDEVWRFSFHHSAIIVCVNSSSWCHKTLTHCHRLLMLPKCFDHVVPLSMSFYQEYLIGQTLTHLSSALRPPSLRSLPYLLTSEPPATVPMPWLPMPFLLLHFSVSSYYPICLRWRVSINKNHDTNESSIDFRGR